MKAWIFALLLMCVSTAGFAQVRKTLPPMVVAQTPATVVQLQDGRMAEMSGNVLRITAPDGRKTIAPPGKFVTRDGRVIVVGERGVIVPEGRAPANLLAHPKPAGATTVPVLRAIPSPSPPRPVLVAQPSPPALKSISPPAKTGGKLEVVPPPSKPAGVAPKPNLVASGGGLGEILPGNTSLLISSPGDDLPAKNKEMTESNGKWALSSGVVFTDKGGGALDTATKHKTLKVTTDPSRVKKLVWQVSALPFDGPGASGPGHTWRNPPGRIATGEVAPMANQPGVFTVPFNALTLMLAKGIRDDAFATQITTTSPPLTAFIRVVPLTASGDLAGAPSNSVTVTASGFSLRPLPPKPAAAPSLKFKYVSYLPPVNYGLHEIYGTNAVPAPNPEHIVAINGNLMVKDLFGSLPDSVEIYFDEPNGDKLKNNDLGFVLDGQELRINWSPADDATVWEKFRDKLVSNPLGTIETAYNDVKADAVSAAGTVLGPEIANVVVDAALVAAGIPPELPNLGELESKGLDFVMDTALEQIGGSGLADAANFPLPGVGSINGEVEGKLKQGVSAGVQAVTKRSQSGKHFIVNPAYQFRPPIAMVEATNPDTKPSAASDQRFSIRVTDYVGDSSVLGGSSRQISVLWTKVIHVPPMPPGATRHIPVVFDFTTQHPSPSDRQPTPNEWVTADTNADLAGNKVEFLGASVPVAQPSLHKAW